MVGWNEVCGLVSQGGLGIWTVKLMNKALLGKWLWRFNSEKLHLWHKVIVAKYGVTDMGWESGTASFHREHMVLAFGRGYLRSMKIL